MSISLLKRWGKNPILVCFFAASMVLFSVQAFSDACRYSARSEDGFVYIRGDRADRNWAEIYVPASELPLVEGKSFRFNHFGYLCQGEYSDEWLETKCKATSDFSEHFKIKVRVLPDMSNPRDLVRRDRFFFRYRVSASCAR